MEAVKSTELPRGRWALGSLKQTEMESAKKSVATRGVAVTEAKGRDCCEGNVVTSMKYHSANIL